VQPAGFPYVLYDGEGGVTRSAFNREAHVPWHNELGDWLDLEETPQGETPLASVEIADQDAGQVVEIDLGPALAVYEACRLVSEGVLLRKLDGGSVSFHAREAADAAARPTLVIADQAGAESARVATADATISASTAKGVGTGPAFGVGADHAVLAFGDCDPARPPTSMKLRLTTSSQSGDANLGLFLLDVPTPVIIEGPPGLSEEYADNVALRADDRVWMATDFDTLPECLGDHCQAPADYCSGFTSCGKPEGMSFATVESEPAENGFTPRSGSRSLRVHQNTTLGGPNLHYRFVSSQVNLGEQEAVRFRYFMFLVDEPAVEAWTPASDHGKMPGFDGPRVTAENSVKCGNGGVPANGTCWSARGGYASTISADNPFYHYTVLYTYAYHPDWQVSGTGHMWPWDDTGQGQLERGKWHCIEQHLQMNTPGEHDGAMEVWVDDRLVMRREDLMLRGSPPYDPEIITETAGINAAWFTFQFGGQSPIPDKPMTLYVDDFVVAKGDAIGGAHIGCK
jgi:hypothetical protein